MCQMHSPTKFYNIMLWVYVCVCVYDYGSSYCIVLVADTHKGCSTYVWKQGTALLKLNNMHRHIEQMQP